MSLKNINKSLQSKRGFTIVELLIVIVVIGILAAITIVAFNGVTARANTTSAEAAASSALKKGEAYNAEENSYPALPADLTGAAASEVYNLTGITFNAGTTGTAPTTEPADPSVLNFLNCSGVDGFAVQYWDYSTDAFVTSYTGAAASGNCDGTDFVTS